MPGFCLNPISDKLGLPAFKDTEKDFLMEFEEVMSPLAAALDMLQGDKEVSLAYLLPCMDSQRGQPESLGQLESKRPRSRHCSPLISALLPGLDKRFGGLLMDNNCLMATRSHSRFNILWTQDQAVREKSKALLQAELNNMSSAPRETRGGQKRSLFNSENGEEEAKNQDMDFLESRRSDMQMIENYPQVRAVFRKYNYVLPSSAAVKRLFSVGGLVLVPILSRLGDELFEAQVLLKYNY